MLPISAEIAREYPDRENMVSPRGAVLTSVHAFEPGIDLALGLVPRHAVARLKPAAELRALTSMTSRSSLMSLPHFC